MGAVKRGGQMGPGRQRQRRLSRFGNNIYGERFADLIDEVLVYNRALTVSEIQTDMGTPVAGTAGPRLTITQPAAGRDGGRHDGGRQLFGLG